MNEKAKSIAIVVQRCGQHIQAGAEVYAFNLAKALAESGIHVEVLTSKSDDYIKWNNNLSDYESIKTSGLDFSIKRFPVIHSRQRILFALVKRTIKYLNKINNNFYLLLSPILDYLFLKSQGPWCPDLWQYLEKNQTKFNLVIVKSYLYAPNFYALKENIKTKKLFIVTAHNEPEFKLAFVKKMISNSNTLAFVSKAEKNLCQEIWHVSSSINSIILPPGFHDFNPENAEEIRPEIFNLTNTDFFLYLGRIDKNKNIDFILNNTPQNCLVIFAGDLKYQLPNDPRFVYIGRVNEKEKEFLLKKTIALLIASRFEAYSIVTAEAIKLNCIVLALKGCPPIDELINEYGGISCDKENFSRTMQLLLDKENRKIHLQIDKIFQDKSWKKNSQLVTEIL
ncbi:glycosyltransferase family 4 protein [Pigmentibacter sp. JX0631]|uniref:glycosyltransferase family 4 protein n=1 Tax=Pigmentibacter sp. JX0631 TaxID=2976982 RepID=UPI0024682A1B|nr:glycosyltransferase family 4 protein [Pigmentibacter sp. JX0631]WGL58969.1 glycosyltransferase family 4 protein [Pigmentibacter sp. JX0631]